MNKKIIGTILGVIGTCLWFMPLAQIEFMGMNMYQSGSHIGGIAYLLIFATLAYSVLSWIEQHIPRVIAAAVALAICGLFFVQAGSSAMWGLYGLIVVNIACVVLAAIDIKSSKSTVVSATTE